jgi:FkbM family methyltransferase
MLTALFRSLSYRRPVQRVVNALHLQRIARKVYYYVARPPGGMLSVEVGTVRARFYIRNLEELRTVETDAFKEQHILERLILTLRPGDVVYDVGANVGLYAVLLGKVVGERGHVIAFEPVRKHYCRLQENLALNGSTQVRSFQKALGDHAGEVKIWVGEVRGDRTGAGAVGCDDHGDDDSQVADAVEGDRFREAAKLPLPALVKIDVEGAEYAVLRGLQETLAQPACKLVMCEIHPQFLPGEVSPEGVLDLLRSLGFTQVELYPCEGRVEFHAICRKP